MKSSDHDVNQTALISRKKPQTSTNAVLSLFGFLLFLTGAFASLVAVIDALINNLATENIIAFIVSLAAIKVGRVVMRKCSA